MFAALCAPSISAAAIIDVARAFTPRFEQVGPLVLLDAGGLSRLFGNAQELGAHLSQALAKHTADAACPERDPRQVARAEGRVEARVAIASTQTAAALLALGRPGLTVVEPGQEEQALAPLSVSVLDRYEHLTGSLRPQAASSKPQAASPDAGSGWHHPRHTHHASRPKPRAQDNRRLDILTKWGIRSLGALAAIPGPEVFERLGDGGLQWQALARGVDARPLVPWVDEVPFEAALELEWPIEGLEPLSFVLARLFEPLSERLEQADRGAAVIHTALRLTTRRVHARTLPLPAPMRDAKTLRTLVLLDLETHPPDAPIDTVRVFIEPTPGRVVQWTLLERAQPAPEQVSTLIARLSALMGETHVGSPQLVDSWKPGAFEMAAFQVSDRSASAANDRDGETSPTLAPETRASEGAPAVPTAPRGEHAEVPNAMRRFRFPIPTRVQVQEGRPIRVNTDRQGFSSGAIVDAAGPWRTSGEWWQEGQAWDRDEWDVAMTDGTIYRLVVERGVGQWFLEGIVD